MGSLWNWELFNFSLVFMLFLALNYVAWLAKYLSCFYHPTLSEIIHFSLQYKYAVQIKVQRWKSLTSWWTVKGISFLSESLMRLKITIYICNGYFWVRYFYLRNFCPIILLIRFLFVKCLHHKIGPVWSLNFASQQKNGILAWCTLMLHN